MNVIVSTRTSNSCWTSLLTSRPVCNIRRLLRSPRRSRSASRATRYLQNAGLVSIQGIPSAFPELTGFITRLHEKIVEESFRSIFKDGAKTAKASETDDYDVERKGFNVKIKVLEDECHRLEKICIDRRIDTRTRKQKTLDKEREQAADDPSRNSSRQRDTTRSNRQGPAIRNDKRRQHVDGHENADEATELATSLGDD